MSGIITRAEAKARGLKRYFTGKSCRYGHIAERYVSGATCCACEPGIQARYIARHPERVRANAAKNQAAYRKRHPDRLAAAYATPRAQTVRRQASQRHLAKRREQVPCLDFPPSPQNSRCQCCGKIATLHLDHDHETGQFRGYLCHHCNTGIGLFGDSTEHMRAGIAYLDGELPWQKHPLPGINGALGFGV